MPFRSFINKFKKNLKAGILSFFLLSFLLTGTSNAKDDLLWKIVEPSYKGETIVGMGRSVDIEGKKVFEGSYELDAGFEDGEFTVGAKSGPSIIVKITRLLLSLIVALSITMILYNGMMYIINTGQGKDGKDLAKNILYIVVGILLALFSVIIITVLQSIAPTVTTDIAPDRGNTIDERLVGTERKGINWHEFFGWF